MVYIAVINYIYIYTVYTVNYSIVKEIPRKVNTETLHIYISTRNRVLLRGLHPARQLYGPYPALQVISIILWQT